MPRRRPCARPRIRNLLLLRTHARAGASTNNIHDRKRHAHDTCWVLCWHCAGMMLLRCCRYQLVIRATLISKVCVSCVGLLGRCRSASLRVHAPRTPPGTSCCRAPYARGTVAKSALRVLSLSHRAQRMWHTGLLTSRLPNNNTPTHDTSSTKPQHANPRYVVNQTTTRQPATFV